MTCNVKLDDAPRGTALLGAAQYGQGEAKLKKWMPSRKPLTGSTQQVVQKLLDWGADVNQMQIDTDVGPLHMACSSSSKKSLGPNACKKSRPLL